MGRGPAWLIQFREDGPRLGPAHQFFRGWAAARPGPSKFQRMGRGPTQSITFSFLHGPGITVRLGPAHQIFASLGPARPGPARHNFPIGLARPGPDERPMTSPGIFGGKCSRPERRFFFLPIYLHADRKACWFTWRSYSLLSGCWFRWCNVFGCWAVAG